MYRNILSTTALLALSLASLAVALIFGDLGGIAGFFVSTLALVELLRTERRHEQLQAELRNLSGTVRHVLLRTQQVLHGNGSTAYIDEVER